MNKPHFVTNHMQRRMRAMRAAGKTYAEIADTEGVSTRTAWVHVQDIRRRNRIDWAAAYKLRKDGLLLREIAERFGVTVAGICLAVKRYSEAA
jgi:transposase